MTTARFATNTLTRIAGEVSFARAALTVGAKRHARTECLAQRAGHEPCAHGDSDRGGSPGAGNV